MVNLTALNDISGPFINTSIIENADEIIPNTIENANTLTGGYFGTIALIACFLVIFYLIFRDDGDVRMDLPTSILISSGFTTIIGVVMLVSGLISTVNSTIWFFTIFVLSFIGVYVIKSKGQL